MKDLNEIRLTGRLTRDPETKAAKNGNLCARFTLAVDRGKDKNGKDKGAYFVPCQAWGKTGEIVEKWARKGRKILVAGSLFVSQYEKDGEKKTFTCVDLDRIILMEAPQSRSESSPSQPGGTLTDNPDFRAAQAQSRTPPTQPGETSIDEYPDNIPF